MFHVITDLSHNSFGCLIDTVYPCIYELQCISIYFLVFYKLWQSQCATITDATTLLRHLHKTHVSRPENNGHDELAKRLDQQFGEQNSNITK